MARITAATAITLGRMACAPLIVLMFFLPGRFAPDEEGLRWAATLLFILAALTDWVDGRIARLPGQASALGRVLDPIADKLLVTACLVVLLADGTLSGWLMVAAAIILLREVLVSGLREAGAGRGVALPVTPWARWKTALQMTALSVLLAGPALDRALGLPVASLAGPLLLWAAAVLTAATGYAYVRVAIDTPHDEERG